jgi:hypothetical protein
LTRGIRNQHQKEKTKMKTLISSAALLVVLVLDVPAASLCLFPVSGGANIFGAGDTIAPAPGGGSGGALPPGCGRTPPWQNGVLTFSNVSGTISLAAGLGVLNGPDGNPSFATDISSFGGISGIKHDGSGFLVGVFLGETEPTDPAPAVLDFRSSGLGTSFLTLALEMVRRFSLATDLPAQALVPCSNSLFRPARRGSIWASPMAPATWDFPDSTKTMWVC